MTETILTKTTKDGRSLEFRLNEYLPGQHTITVYLAGKYFCRSGVYKLSKPAAPGITHSVDKVGITEAEADQLSAAIKIADEAYRQTPEGQTEALRRQRERIVSEIAGLREFAGDEFERLHSHEDPMAYPAKAAAMKDVEAARAKLAEFDARHPEIVAEIKAERKATAERHMWD